MRGAAAPRSSQHHAGLPKEVLMATYILLCNFTEQGIRNVKDTTRRADAVKQQAAQFGATMKDLYWTLGGHDLVCIVEAADEASMTAFGLALGSAGNVR